MAVTRDIEQQVEDAFYGVLNAYSDITGSATVRHWKDASVNKTYPVVLVHCSPVDQHEGTPQCSTSTRLYVAHVELGVVTYSYTDTEQEMGRYLLGAIRDCLSQSGILAALDAVTGVDVTFHGLLPAAGAHTVEDGDNTIQMSLTVACHVSL
jgi:hypothetical protein